MTIETTHPATNTTSSIQLRSYMQALSVAEQIMSQSPVMPTEINILVGSWAPGSPEIRFYFHHDPDSLRQFAAELLMEVTTQEREDGSLYTVARVSAANGVRVQAWTLSSPAEQDNEAAAVAA